MEIVILGKIYGISYTPVVSISGRFITGRFITKREKHLAVGALLTDIVRCSQTT